MREIVQSQGHNEKVGIDINLEMPITRIETHIPARNKISSKLDNSVHTSVMTLLVLTGEHILLRFR